MAQQLRERPRMDVPAADGHARTFLRWAGYSGLLASLAFLTTGVMTTVSAAEPPANAGEIVAYLQDASQVGWSWSTYGVAGIALVVLYIPMAVGMYRLLGRTPTAWFGTAAVIVGLAALLPAYVISTLTPVGLVPAVTGVGDAGAEALYVTYAYAEAAASVFFAVGSVLSLGFGSLLWGVSWVRSRDSARWLGWVAVVVGVTGMAWFSLDLDGPVLPIVVAVNALLALLLFTGLSLALVSDGRARAS